MVDTCKTDDCIQMFLRAIENSQNVNSAPILLQLVETTKDKKTAFAGWLMTKQVLIFCCKMVKIEMVKFKRFQLSSKIFEITIKGYNSSLDS